MRLQDFDYYLPPELIAQTPAEPRDSSRLLVLNKRTGEIQHAIFRDLPNYLSPGDVLVFNDTRVIPARLHGRRKQTGGNVEFLLVRHVKDTDWEAMGRPARRLKTGERVTIAEDLDVQVLEKLPEGLLLIRLPQEVHENLDKYGEIPLPPYIHDFHGDASRYQTVYARDPGAVAAPTAGLHFTEELISRLRDYGVDLRFITLHVGPGTFQPVKTERIEEHKMHSERYYIPEGLLEYLEEKRSAGNRVVAVGTTSVRALEDAAVRRQAGAWVETDLFIKPGYQFKIVDALITNFHLPKSTLMMLVAAIGGYEHIMNAYRIAVENRYRFYSFGDAMLII